MHPSTSLVCDGCGLPASSEHITTRLKRLEWATRFRPVHIGVLFLGSVSPAKDEDYLYSVVAEAQAGAPRTYTGEAARILDAVGIAAGNSAATFSADAILAEFQHRGYFLAHVLECPLSASGFVRESLTHAIARQIPHALARIRRSLRPKRIAVISGALQASAEALAANGCGATLLLDEGMPFGLDGADPVSAVERLRAALTVAAATAR